MAGSIPPLVSSSPPPLCAFDDEEEEDEDEFGMYTTAAELDYNECISFKEKDEDKQGGCKGRGEQDSTSQDSATDSGLCPDSEGMSPTPHSDDERTLKQRLQVPSECGDSSSGLTNGLEEAHQPVDNFGNFENFNFSDQGKILQEKSELNCVLEEDKNNTLGITEKHLAGEKTVAIENVLNHMENFNVNNELSNCNAVESNLIPQHMTCELSDLEQDVQNIQNENRCIEESGEKNTAVNEQYEAVANGQLEDDNEDEFDDFTVFKANFSNSVEFTETEQSEKLSEHSKPFSEQEQSEEAAKSLPVQQEESDDEFSNFADFSSSDCAFVSAQSSNSSENISQIPVKSYDDSDFRTESEYQDWLSVFPSDASEPEVAGEGALLKEDDVVWTRLFPLESSPALSHQWADSLANRHLLSALNIDSRNILFMPWSNTAVPRFAANLSRGPLEPVKAIEPLQPTPVSLPPLTSNTLESVPDAHFDWVSSGLTNPLDYPKPVLNTKKTLSAEAEAILSSLPDISFMRKTYIDFPINEA